MPQNIDPNHRANPIDAANLAIANLHAEREQMRQLIHDYRQFVSELDPRYGYGVIRQAEKDELQQRAHALLEGK